MNPEASKLLTKSSVDLTALNKSGEIRDAIDDRLLKAIIREYLDLLLSSAAVYEKNGDYAIGIFSSGWCRYLDNASRQLCNTDDDREALKSGKWLCHESCWKTSRTSIEDRAPADFPCKGGIRIYAVPIFAGDEVVGSINFGYGTPPKDPEILKEIAARYDVSETLLKAFADDYASKKPEIIQEAKERLNRAAQLIGEIVQRKRVEKDLRKALKEKEYLIKVSEIQRKKAEEAERAAVIANKAKSTFLANMSHEFRTPLAVIQSFLELISVSLDEQNQLHEYIATAERNCDHLGQLIDDILDLSKVESGKFDLVREPIDILALIKEVLAILEPKAKEKGLKLEFEASKQMPHRVLSNGFRLRQILINIIGNALKFTFKGEVKVSCNLEFTKDSKFLTNIRVKDSGIGITPENQKKLFKPFAQIPAEASTRIMGTGLGLALSKNLAIALGGDLVIEQSEVGRGSVFLITLDAGSFDDIEFFKPSPQHEPLIAEKARIPNKQLTNRKILLVEDQEDLQKSLSLMLEHHGALVDKASNGQEGVGMALSKYYDVILMDVVMPVLNGYEAIKIIKQTGYPRPILAVTAHAMLEQKLKLKASGVDEIVKKPVRKNELLSVIVRHTTNLDQLNSSD